MIWFLEKYNYVIDKNIKNRQTCPPDGRKKGLRNIEQNSCKKWEKLENKIITIFFEAIIIDFEKVKIRRNKNVSLILRQKL